MSRQPLMYIAKKRLIDFARLVNLLKNLTASDLKRRYASSYLGLFWAFGTPLLFSFAYMLVFGLFMAEGVPGRKYGGASFIPYYLIGFAPWTLFNEIITRSGALLLDNRNLVTKIKFPHIILPFTLLLSATIPFLVIGGIGLGVLACREGVHLPQQLIFPCLSLILIALLAIGLSWTVASICVYIPDLNQAISVVMTLWFFGTPILYPPDLIESKGSSLFKILALNINPMTTAVDMFRAPFFGVRVTFGNDALFLTAISLSMFAAGYFCYRNLQKGFADVL